MNGFINILKPSGLTSSDVVVRVRKTLSKNLGKKIKVGHLGTLDPGGSGVLPVAVGTATKLFDYLIYKEKIYVAGIKFGKTTDTLDSYGQILESKNFDVNLEKINEVSKKFIGEIDQIPPKYSAINIKGKKAYDLARSGEDIILPTRKVTINDIKIDENSNSDFDLTINCNGGTYIRSLVRDIAIELDTVSYMSYIVRTKSGYFDIENAITLEEFEKNPLGYFVSIDAVLKNYFKFYEIPKNVITKVLNGVKLNIEGLPKDKFVATYDNKIVGMAENIDEKLILLNRL